MTIIKTVCSRDCPDSCFIDASVEKGRLLKTRGSSENPFTQGFICPRGNGDPKRVYSPNRVLYPFVRSEETPSESFVRKPWDHALDNIAQKLSQTIAEHGNEAVLLYDYCGNMGLLSWQFPRRLWMALGATTTDYTLCSSSGHAGIGLHYGLSYGFDIETLQSSKLIIFWGSNAKICASHQWALANKARRNHGATLICIDPRKSETSQASDISIQPRPGSDVALTYGLARYLIENSGLDQCFLTQWTIGYQDYAAEAMKWTPDRVEDVTGIPPDLIEKVGKLLVQESKTAAFMVGFGLQKSLQGGEAARAVSLLPALLGNHRGFHYSNGSGRKADINVINGKSQTKKTGKKVNQVSIGKRLARGEFKFVFVLGSNPAATLPDQAAVRAGLKRNDVFLVVQDTHWSETASLADIVLPAPTYLEKKDIIFSDHHSHCRLSQKTIEPLKESRHEIRVMQELAGKLNRTETWLFEDPWHVLDFVLKDTLEGGDLNDILDGQVLRQNIKALNQYQTPSGKIEFSSSKAIDIGVTSLPFQAELTLKDHEFILLNSAIANYTHSQFTDVYGPIPEILWINPEDAANYDIEDGTFVEIFNDSGSVLLKARITQDVLSKTLWAPRPLTGLNGEPLNILTPGISQQLGDGPVFNSIKVRLRPDPAPLEITSDRKMSI